MVLTEGLNQVNKKMKIRKFEEFQTLNEECHEIIKQSWTRSDKDPADKLIDNGKQVLEELTSQSKVKFGNISRKINAMKEKLTVVQCNLDKNPQFEMTLMRELDSLLAVEEIYWKQR